MTRTPVEVASGRNEDLTRIHIHTRKEVMRILAGLILGLMVVGCGQTDTERLEEENKKLKAQLENNKLKLELEADNKNLEEEILELSVVGTYELKKDEKVWGMVLLENGVMEWNENGRIEAETKWKIENGELHYYDVDVRIVEVLRINPDGSVTYIASIIGEIRTDTPKEHQYTFKKIK